MMKDISVRRVQELAKTPEGLSGVDLSGINLVDLDLP